MVLIDKNCHMSVRKLSDRKKCLNKYLNSAYIYIYIYIMRRVSIFFNAFSLDFLLNVYI